MENKLELIEGAIYKLKKTLPALKYGVKTSLFGFDKVVLKDSDVYLDQFIRDGNIAIFGCFNPSIGYYCVIPVEYCTEEFLERGEDKTLIPLKKTVDKEEKIDDNVVYES